MSEIITFDEEAKKKILAGVTLLSRVVRLTLGPRGKSVVIRSKDGKVRLEKESRHILDAVHSLDLIENLGIKMLKESVAQMEDGVATTLVIAEAIIRLGRGQGLKIKEAIPALCNALSDLAVEVEIEREFSIPSGYLSPYFITNKDAMCCELDHPEIFVAKNPSITEIIPVLENIPKGGSLLIIAEKIDKEIINILIINDLKVAVVLSDKTIPFKKAQKALITQNQTTLLGVLEREKVKMVPGGGVALVRALEMADVPEVLKEALKEPFKAITENAGFDASLAFSTIEKGSSDFGLNVLTGIFAPLFPAQITDPLILTQEIIKNAISTASQILTVETIIRS